MKELIITRQPGTKFGAGFRIANFANLSKWLQTDFHSRRRELITRFNCSYVKNLAWYTWLASYFLEESRPGLQQSPMNTAPVLAAGSEPSRSLVLWTESHGTISRALSRHFLASRRHTGNGDNISSRETWNTGAVDLFSRSSRIFMIRF